MIRIPESLEVRNAATTFFVVACIVCVFIRMASVAIWCVAKGHGVDDTFVVEAGLTVVSDLILLCIIGVVSLQIRRPTGALSYEPVATALTAYSVSALALLVFAALVPNDLMSGSPTTYVGVLTSHIVSIASFGISIGLAGFLALVFICRRHTRARTYLFIQFGVLLSIWLCSALTPVSNVFNVLSWLLIMIGGVLILVNTRGLDWLTTTTMDKKVRLLWLTFCGLFASIVLTAMFLTSTDSYVTASAASFVRSGEIVIGSVNFFGFVFFLRLLFSTVAALPNSGIVDRRSYEVESLAHITRLMAEAVSVEHLLKSTTALALRICRAHGAWTEVYDGKESRVVAAELVHPEYVRVLHANPIIHKLISETTKPIHIQSMDEVSRDLDTVAVRSMIVVPIYADHRRSATMVVFSTVDYGFEPDDLRLLTAFGDMVSVAIDQARLMEAALAKERLQKEADVAREIQSSLLPRIGPNVEPFSVHSVMIPATEVGGDYFDYIRFSDGSRGVIIADVAGKGIPAALYMATLKGAVLAEMRVSSGPADLLCRVNETLMGSMEKHSYISLTCVQFDPTSCVLRIARSGHTPAICRVRGEVVVLQPRGVAIGIVPPATFNANIEQVEVAMTQGDVCLLTTDGANERRNRMGIEIGTETILELVRTTKVTSASALIEMMLLALESHAEGTEPHDDITLVGIVVNTIGEIP